MLGVVTGSSAHPVVLARRLRGELPDAPANELARRGDIALDLGKHGERVNKILFDGV